MVETQIWEDLKTSGVAAANLTVNKPKKPIRMPKYLNLLLHSLGFLKRYLTEDEREPLLDKTPKIILNHKWPFI